MNIAIVTTEFVSENNFDGGLANYTFKLAKLLLNRGHVVTVYLTSSESGEFNYEGVDVVKVRIPDFKWHLNYYLKKIYLGFLMSRKMGFKIQAREMSYFMNKFLKQELLKKKIDIIHYPNLASLVLFRLKNVPSIVRLSGSTIRSQELGGYGEDNLKVKIMGELEYKAMKNADAIFGPSVMIAKETEQIIKKKVTVIETPFLMPVKGLDNSVYNNTLKNKKYILFFGSIGLIKGVGTIAEIIYEFLNNHSDYYYVFVGKKLQNEIHEKNIWDYLIDKAAEHKNRVIHFDPIQHEQLFPIILNADIITLPSRIDNFPNTCIEAMSQGKIVIGTQGNGFEQLIEHEKSGYLIPVDNHKALLEIINKVLGLGDHEKNNLRKNALERINLLSPDYIIPQMENFYKSVINN